MAKFYKPFFRFIDDVGDGSGVDEHNLNYSAGKVLKIIPQAGETMIIHRLITDISDGRAGFAADTFGAISALTNGIQIKVENASGVLINLTNGLPIKQNSHWGRFCYDVNRVDFGAGDYSLQSRWTFANSGTPIKLDADAGEFLAMYLEDDFSALTNMTFMYQGYYLDAPLEANPYE